MCLLSVVTNYGITNIPPWQWTIPAWDGFKSIMDCAAEVDEATGQPDCQKDHDNVEEYVREVEDLLDIADDSVDSIMTINELRFANGLPASELPEANIPLALLRLGIGTSSGWSTK